MAETSPPAPPGWYELPGVGSRYWDGQAWVMSEQGVPQTPQRPRGMPWWGWLLIALGGFGVLFVIGFVVLLLIGASLVATQPPGTARPAPSMQVQYPSQACLTGAQRMIAEEDEMYKTHPFYSDDVVPGPDASLEEREAFREIMRDEERLWTEIHDRFLHSCDGPEDWWRTVQKYPRIAGFTDASLIEREDIRNWCGGNEDVASACVGIEEWLR